VFRQHDLVPSQAMGRRMHVWRFGHYGMPLVVFPSAAGFAHEWDAHGMVEALGGLINDGKIKLYCTETNVAEAWTRKEDHPAERIKRHMAFERYVLSELVPQIREDCRTPDIPVAASGCSLGAFYSANFALKHPEVFRYALCLSGCYDATGYTQGFSNQDIYFSNPMAYAPRMNGEHLERVKRSTRLVLVCGQGPWEDGNLEETKALGGILAAKGIDHELDVWGHDVAHEWPWWRRQALYHLGRRFGG
jgi:esterase/lipase superfamily enzyme